MGERRFGTICSIRDIKKYSALRHFEIRISKHEIRNKFEALKFKK